MSRGAKSVVRNRPPSPRRSTEQLSYLAHSSPTIGFAFRHEGLEDLFISRSRVVLSCYLNYCPAVRYHELKHQQ